MRRLFGSSGLKRTIKEEGRETRDLILDLSKQSARQRRIWAVIGIAVSIIMGVNIARLVSNNSVDSRVLLIAHDSRIDLWSPSSPNRTIWSRNSTYFGALEWSESGHAAILAIPRDLDGVAINERSRIVLYDSNSGEVEDIQCGRVCENPTWLGESLYLFGEGTVNIIDMKSPKTSNIIDLTSDQSAVVAPPATPIRVLRVLAKSEDKLLLALAPSRTGGYGFGYNLALMDEFGQLTIKPSISSDVAEGGPNVGLIYTAQNQSSGSGASGMGWRNGYCQQNDHVEEYDLAGARNVIEGPYSEGSNVLNWLDYSANGTLVASWSSTVVDGFSGCIFSDPVIHELQGRKWHRLEPAMPSARFDILDPKVSAILYQDFEDSYVHVVFDDIESRVEVSDPWTALMGWSYG